MRVRLKVQIGGFRNAEPWPAPGDTLDVPDHEGADLIAAGYAEEASGDASEDDARDEQAVASSDEPAVEADDAATAKDSKRRPARARK